MTVPPRALRPAVVTATSLLLAAPGALAEGARRPWELSLGAEALALVPSDYTETLRAFELGAPSWALTLAARVTRSVHPRLALGARAAWLWTAAEPVTRDRGAPAAANGPAGFHVVDASAVARVVALGGAGRGGARVHFDVELGAAMGFVTILTVTQQWAGPRAGAAMLVGYQFRDPAGYVGLRMGFQYVPWGGAGGSAFDPVFSGFHLGVEAGVAP